jgi:hypothetical protein
MLEAHEERAATGAFGEATLVSPRITARVTSCPALRADSAPSAVTGIPMVCSREGAARVRRGAQKACSQLRGAHLIEPREAGGVGRGVVVARVRVAQRRGVPLLHRRRRPELKRVVSLC